MSKTREILDVGLKGNHERRLLALAIRFIQSNRRDITDPDTLLALLKAGDVAAVCSRLEIPPQMYGTAENYFADTQVVAFLKKYPWENNPWGVDPDAVAKSTFLKCERRMRRVNRAMRLRMCNGAARFRYPEVLRHARSFVRRVIGEELPPLADLFEGCDFGPGSSIGVSGNSTHFLRKILADEWTVTPDARPFILPAMVNNIHYCSYLLPSNGSVVSYDPLALRYNINAKVVGVDYNRITFVPKTAKTSRSIAVEPLMNGYLQKGVDVWMRKQLKKARLDISDQLSNQRLAYSGSVNWTDNSALATIDLSAASDSLSIEFVKALVPPEWFGFLNCLRSPAYSSNGVTTRYEKFVSMGNGFCFPLETMLFAAIVHGVYMAHGLTPNASVNFRVYGDDIIVQKDLALAVIEVLRYCGFRLNLDKTFVFGPFRESCGADFWNGRPVRPVYADGRLDNLHELFVLHNGRKDPPWQECQRWLRAITPEWGRFMRPYPGEPDSAFEVDLDTFMGCASARWSKHEQRWSWEFLQRSPVADKFRVDALSWQWAYSTVAVRGGSSSLPFPLRRQTRSCVVNNHPADRPAR